MSTAVIDDAVVILGDNKKRSAPHQALHWKDVPAFYATLSDDDPTQLASRMLILPGVRSDSINNMRLGQLMSSVWIIPPLHVKSRADSDFVFDVPLSKEHLHVIELAKKHSRNGYLFPNSTGGPLNKMAMRNFLVDNNISARPHGFRSSLRTWLMDEIHCEEEIAEACIGHVRTGDEAVDAYKRSTYLPKRTPLMKEWANFITGNS